MTVTIDKNHFIFANFLKPDIVINLHLEKLLSAKIQAQSANAGTKNLACGIASLLVIPPLMGPLIINSNLHCRITIVPDGNPL